MADLVFEGVSKAFPGVQALADVSFVARAGEVHALCGENGAGKSTLLKVLSGVYRPDSGTVRVGDREHRPASPAEALAGGVAVIYQELHLVPEMTVAENILLGHLPASGGVVRRTEMVRQALEALRSVGVDLDPNMKVGRLPIALQQVVEIAKAISRNAQVVAFDEPTSSLSEREIETLFRLIERERDEGRVVLYVSHRMAEIKRICDSVTVLRDGRHVETFDRVAEVSTDTIINRMVGRDLQDVFAYRPREIGEPVLEVRGLTSRHLAAPVDLTVRAGEIVGLFGLVGAGRSELFKALFGADRSSQGQVSVDGRSVRRGSIPDAIDAGLALCPEDRKKEGLVPMGSVHENVAIRAGRRLARFGFAIDRGAERVRVEELTSRLAVRTPSLRQLVSRLSGGNQQKVILARWLGENVRVLLLDEPTRGIDVGAKQEIYRSVYDLAERGVAVVFVSSELPEVMGVSDRILVMNSGAVVQEFARGAASADDVLRAALPKETVAVA